MRENSFKEDATSWLTCVNSMCDSQTTFMLSAPCIPLTLILCRDGLEWRT
ncbi:hypothetical protein Taro_040907, partial [Colocasia esculenta]|nr:hypothetical protein [Colocasia esculenta]